MTKEILAHKTKLDIDYSCRDNSTSLSPIIPFATIGITSVVTGRLVPVRLLTMETLQDLGKQYQQRFAARAPYRDAVWQALVRGFFQDYVQPNAVVLDLGSGWGEFIRHIKAQRRI